MFCDPYGAQQKINIQLLSTRALVNFTYFIRDLYHLTMHSHNPFKIKGRFQQTKRYFPPRPPSLVKYGFKRPKMSEYCTLKAFFDGDETPLWHSPPHLQYHMSNFPYINNCQAQVQSQIQVPDPGPRSKYQVYFKILRKTYWIRCFLGGSGSFQTWFCWLVVKF